MTPSTQTPTCLPQALLAHWSRIVRLSLHQSEQAVGDMLQAVSELNAQLTPLSASAAPLARLNEGLQYQDRQRQMLELLLADLHAAMALAPQQAGALDMDAWMDHFESHCPIPELRRDAASLPAALTLQAPTGLDYF